MGVKSGPKTSQKAMITLNNKFDCCGCGACAAACPVKAISFETDSEGFWYPSTDVGTCINCGLCNKVCPFIGDNPQKIDSSECWGLKNKDVNEQLDSASGGIFSLIAKQVLNIGGFVVAARYNNDWQVEHMVLSDIQELKYYRRSKYVQSHNFDSYKTVKQLLKEGKFVAYFGTPCQCLSLKKYLRKDSINLQIVDIVCHGVPSPMVWDKYLHEKSSEYGESVNAIENIQFKYKNGDKYYWRHPGFLIDWSDGKRFLVFANKTSYENGYLSNLFVRPSCHNCRVKGISSQSDLTIGDFWGADMLGYDIYDKNGTSILFVNTDKGRAMFQHIYQHVAAVEVPISDATRYNQRIMVSPKPHGKRSAFFSQCAKMTLDELVPQLLKLSFKEKMLRKVVGGGKKFIHFIKRK